MIDSYNLLPEHMRSKASGALAQPRPNATNPNWGSTFSVSSRSWNMASLERHKY